MLQYKIKMTIDLKNRDMNIMKIVAIICLTILAVITLPTLIGSCMCIYYIYHLVCDKESEPNGSNNSEQI